ncbi:carbohydrate binding family 6 [Glarea lozoyensis ATCC 20868]|uniref:Carbohydrate binding family 6 n=1 Tax=Glarea lozoyensis (strain ATCC 20868 / MF5171) TaxID=1116229 RepID=S3CDL2_GLAL2|nr:carbohydrate binding family 6 [Glarea lozoyensis ATCC 20868]EPE24612.1 carbohydrate binding family 6 [Glarea lozoyensis ATCC 20868]
MVTKTTLNVALKNQSNSNTIFAYITGLALDNGNQRVILRSDGKTPYYPSSPAKVGSPLEVDCGIPLGPPGSTAVVTIPRIAGGRIWFCMDDKLTFLLNPGPGLIEPSVSNPSDPNYNKNWGFCEFTFNDAQLFANISYVDFVSIPISMTLTNDAGASQSVAGMPANGLQTVCDNLVAQNQRDNAGWNQLIVNTAAGKPLRALSPNTGHVMNQNLFAGYYDSYVNACWDKYTSTPLKIDTQAEWGVVTGTVKNGLLIFPGLGTFAKPSTTDIFSCSTGPFGGYPNNAAAMGAIGARLAAALNRSTLLSSDTQPTSDFSAYYATTPTNYYSRIVHAANIDGRGYAFPYDDVGAGGGDGGDQAGTVFDGAPKLFTVAVGGR